MGLKSTASFGGVARRVWSVCFAITGFWGAENRLTPGGKGGMKPAQKRRLPNDHHLPKKFRLIPPAEEQ